MGMENLPYLIRDFKFYYSQLKNPVGTPDIKLIFPVGMRINCSFLIGMTFQQTQTQSL